jgi:hypothetical protein
LYLFLSLSLPPHPCYMYSPSHPPWVDHPNDI